jgi:hypothetical protein
MITTITLILGIAVTTYEAVVRVFPNVDIKFSIIHKILNLLQIVSGALNNKK